MKRTLIAYFSRKGENYSNGEIISLKKGNTETAAEMIAELTGGDLFEIETVKDYPKNYTACTEEAMKELRENARPELKAYPKSIDGYDTIILGYPNWWGTMPMPLFTFLEHLDLEGKRILPFCTNEGSGMGKSEKDLIRICPKAEIKKGLSIHGREASHSLNKIKAWLEEVLND